MMGTSTTRTGLRAGVAAVAALVVLGTAACGDQQAGGPSVTSSTSGDPVTPSPSAPSPSTPSPSAPASGEAAPAPSDASLTVTLDDGNGSTSTWTLTCAADGTVGGDHPDAVNACAALAVLEDPFKPVPKDMACTMIYGGPQKATVQGTWNGRDVLTTFDRVDGCRIARWDRVAPLLQPGTTAGRSAGGA